MCYQKGLVRSFQKNNIKIKEQIHCPTIQDGGIIKKRFLDFWVEEKIIVEIKEGIDF